MATGIINDMINCRSHYSYMPPNTYIELSKLTQSNPTWNGLVVVGATNNSVQGALYYCVIQASGASYACPIATNSGIVVTTGTNSIKFQNNTSTALYVTTYGPGANSEIQLYRSENGNIT